MLPLFRNHLQVTLYPTHVVVVKRASLQRRQTSAPVVLSFEQQDGLEDWQVPITVFSNWLQQNKVTGASLRIVVADSFMRYALIPWVDNVHKPSEMEALARIHIESLYGAQSGRWLVRTCYSDYGMAIVATAFDRSLFEAIQKVCAQHKLTLNAFAPQMQEVFNRCRKKIQPSSLLGVIEASQCLFASFKEGAWHSLRIVKLPVPLKNELSQLFDRELVLQGLGKQVPIYIHTAQDFAVSFDSTERAVTYLNSQFSATRLDDVVVHEAA